ncbi:MAG: hypothetical protein JO368_01145 [Acidimicrobiales bacterium]|nr:hypothetical protein [Acidimicrobiales bacterium]
MRGTANGGAPLGAGDASRPKSVGTPERGTTGTLLLEREAVDDDAEDGAPSVTNLIEGIDLPSIDVRPRRTGPTTDLFPPGAGRRRSWRRMATLGVVGAVSIAGLVAWGMSRGSGTAFSSDPVVAAVQRTVEARTADLSVRLTATSPRVAPVDATGTGTVDLRQGAAQERLDFGPGSLEGQHLGEVFLGNTMYLSVPVLTALVPGKPWVEEPAGPQALIAPSNADPVATLGLLGSGAGRVVDLGRARVAGVPVEAYRVTVEPGPFSRALGRSNLPAPVRSVAAASMGTTPDIIVVDVDAASGTVRQTVADIELGVVASPVVVQVVTDFHGAGHRVVVSSPPSSQALTMAELQAAARANAPSLST